MRWVQLCGSLSILWHCLSLGLEWIQMNLDWNVFVVMLSKAHLTSHSRMSGSRWVITPSRLSGSWRFFLYSSSVYSWSVNQAPSKIERKGIFHTLCIWSWLSGEGSQMEGKYPHLPPLSKVSYKVFTIEPITFSCWKSSSGSSLPLRWMQALWMHL